MFVICVSVCIRVMTHVCCDVCCSVVENMRHFPEVFGHKANRVCATEMNLRRRDPVYFCVIVRAFMVLIACCVCSYVGLAVAGCTARASAVIWALSAVGTVLTNSVQLQQSPQ